MVVQGIEFPTLGILVKIQDGRPNGVNNVGLSVVGKSLTSFDKRNVTGSRA